MRLIDADKLREAIELEGVTAKAMFRGIDLPIDVIIGAVLDDIQDAPTIDAAALHQRGHGGIRAERARRQLGQSHEMR